MKKRKKINFLLTVFLGVLFVSGVKMQAQTTLRIKDLVVMPVLDPPNPSDTTKIYFNISFKIDSSAFAKTVNLNFGTAMDSSDVAVLHATVVPTTTNNYALLYNGQQYDIKYYTGYLIVTLLKSQTINLKYLALYVEDKNAGLTNKLYYSFNP